MSDEISAIVDNLVKQRCYALALDLNKKVKEMNEDFKKNVAIPYFKDIYKDLAAQSDAKSKGINKVSILNVSSLCLYRTASISTRLIDLSLCTLVSSPLQAMEWRSWPKKSSLNLIGNINQWKLGQFLISADNFCSENHQPSFIHCTCLT